VPRKFKVTLLGLEIVQRLKDCRRDANRLDFVTLCHRLSVGSPEGRAPLVYTIDLTCEPDGLYVATCRELPELIIGGDTEEEALAKVELHIEHLLAARHSFLLPPPRAAS
jgi:predicted RNase H-like HicB family nuclease